MTQPLPNTKPPFTKKHSYIFLSLLIIGLSALVYIGTLNIASKHNENVLPVADQSVYITQLFDLIERGQREYFETIKDVLSNNNWYWLYRLSVTIISPFLLKEPFSICVVNYIFLAIASLSLARLAIRLNLPFSSTLFLSLVFWLAPWIYGHWTTLSLFALQLETSFYWILTIASIHSILYALEPKSHKNAFIAALFTGLAVWGRGNSLPYVLIVLACPLLLISIRAWKTKNKNLVLPAITFVVTSGLLIGWFYYFTLENIAWYYGRGFGNIYNKEGGSIAYFFNNFNKIISSMGWTFARFPGVFITKNPYSSGSVVLSFLFHFFTILSLYVSLYFWKKHPTRRHRIILYTSLTGCTLYVGNLLMGLLLFSEHFASGEILVFYPMLLMLVGLMLMAFSIIAIIINIKTRASIATSQTCISILIFFVAFSYFFTKQSTPITQDASLPKPYYVENFSKNIDRITEGKTLNILWYGIAYNASIINYYRAKSGLPLFNPTVSTEESLILYENLPDETYNRLVSQDTFKNTLKKIISRSQFLIIPEDVNSLNFMLGNPGIAKRKKDLVQFFNSSSRPAYAVKMILHDYNSIRLLLLERINVGDVPKDMDPLKFPYGETVEDTQYSYPNAIQYDLPRKPHPNNFSAYLLIDDALHTFWESAKSFPHIFGIRLYESTKLTQYSFSSGVHSQSENRMPLEWEVWGSIDGKDWKLVDKKEVSENWKDEERREFFIANPGHYLYYQFKILKTNEPSVTRIYELQLFRETENSESKKLNEWDFYTWEDQH